MPAKVAFIGLGVMGYCMAGHLSRAGNEVAVYNRTQAKAELWGSEFSGRIASTPAEAASHAEYVFACVGNDDDLRSVALGQDGALSAMSEGAVFIDHTTASIHVERELSTYARQRKLNFLDAPVSGGQAGAQKGQLAVMVGGDVETMERSRDVMSSYAKIIKFMGPVGSGQLTKMVNQICLAGLTQSLAEALNFMNVAGLEVSDVKEILSQGAAQSWMMDNRAETMISDEFDFGFAVNWMRKDLSIAIEQANTIGCALPVTALVDQFLAKVQSSGLGRLDYTSLIKLLRV